MPVRQAFMIAAILLKHIKRLWESHLTSKENKGTNYMASCTSRPVLSPLAIRALVPIKVNIPYYVISVFLVMKKTYPS